MCSLSCVCCEMSVHGQEFAKGDQSYQGRRKFWESGYKCCPACNGNNIKEETHSAGCRHNGDGYGTAVFTCETEGCNWRTSFLYDEGGDGPYYHETRSWSTPKETENIKIEYKTLTADKRASFVLMLKQADAEVVERMMGIQGYSPDDISSLLGDEALKQELRSQGHSEAEIKNLLSPAENNDHCSVRKDSCHTRTCTLS